MIDLADIVEGVEDGFAGLGYIEPAKRLAWVRLSQISGLDAGEVAERNRTARLNDAEEIPSDIGDTIERYLFFSFRQHTALNAGYPDIAPIGELEYLDTLLELAVELELNTVNVLNVPREKLDAEELSKAAELFSKWHGNADSTHMKERIADWFEYFFCVTYVAPEIERLPNISNFTNSPDFEARLMTFLS